jgi:DNA-binding protein H-NS
MMAKAAQAHAAKATNGSFNVAGYSFEELQEIREHIDAEIESRKAHEIEALRARVNEGALALGISVHELFGVSRGKRETKHPRGPQPAKYKGPNGELWSGKGPAPKWMKPLLAKGKTKADFLIK